MASFKLDKITILLEIKGSCSHHVKSYVTSKEVVSKFSDGKFKKIRLPKDRMLVAMTPYMNPT